MSNKTRIQLLTAQDLGKLIRETRLSQHLKQVDLATVSGTGERFIVDLERGKPTCELEKAFHIARMLGIKIEASNFIGSSND